MLRRACDVRGDPIASGVPYRVGTLRLDDAAWLMDVDDARLVPTWTQLPDGTIQIDVCLGCVSQMPRANSMLEVW
jgi:hypothetical protein